jgi:hypothetical protein
MILFAAALAVVASAQTPQIYSQMNGSYLGNLSANRYDLNSTSNPYGPYGSRYSLNSINNPYGPYGSPYSNYSARNPYASQAPMIFVPSTMPMAPIMPYTSMPTMPSLPSLPGLPGLPPLF